MGPNCIQESTRIHNLIAGEVRSMVNIHKATAQYISELEEKLKELQESTSPWTHMTMEQLRFFLRMLHFQITQLQGQRDEKFQRIKDAHNPKMQWEIYSDSLEYVMEQLTQAYHYENEINDEITRRKDQMKEENRA